MGPGEVDDRGVRSGELDIKEVGLGEGFEVELAEEVEVGSGTEAESGGGLMDRDARSGREIGIEFAILSFFSCFQRNENTARFGAKAVGIEKPEARSRVNYYLFLELVSVQPYSDVLRLI